jgi:uncharacterized phage protein gp47/JayE
MPFERPTLNTLLDQTASEMESRLPGLLARVRRSLAGVIARMVAGAVWALYGYAEWLDRQKWPDLADAEFLDWHGGRWGVLRKEAASATGTVRFTGVDGTVVPVATVVQRADAVQYATTAEGLVAAGQALVPAQAVVAGQAGNADINTALTLASPIAGVAAAATTHTAFGNGAEIEADEPYRARILEHLRKPPQGGSAPDYIAWALEVAGVTRAWVYPEEQGAGTLVVRFTRDDDASPIPDAGEVATVQAYIDARRPVTAHLYVVAPVAVPVNFTLSVTPNTAAVKAAVEAELRALILRDAQPGTTLKISHIREAISIAAGEDDYVLTAPAADVPMATGQMATMGVLTWL